MAKPASIRLFQLLEACDAERLEFPKETRHFETDEKLCLYLCRYLAVEGYEIHINSVERAFSGEPVKRVYGICKSILKIQTLVDRDGFLRRYARKRKPSAEVA